ncbi:MAG: cobalamin-dependent protein [Phycisphaerales bacterium]|nr:cobalamin-dependent protein [Phycisphaerales bacterium]
MSYVELSERLLEALIDGDRAASRAVVDDAHTMGSTAEDIVAELYWPTYETIEKLYRGDQLSNMGHHLATRLLRTLVDQASQHFDYQPSNGRTVFAVCGPTDADELAGQIAADFIEREGYSIKYAGGGIASDEVLEMVQTSQPDVLLLFASAPSDLPDIRALIDQLGEIGACRKTQIVVGGGVFNRAEGLAEEIGADLWAEDPCELCEVLLKQATRRATAEQRTVGRKARPQPVSTGGSRKVA